METPQLSDEAYEIAETVSRRAQKAGLTVATAESLTCGQVAAHLGAASSSSSWFRGGVVAYDDEVKYKVLGVPRGRVISEDCGTAMAEGVRRLLDADVAVAVTGVGGPDEQEGQPPGTVYIAVAGADGGTCRHHRFDGDPKEVLTATALEALKALATQMDSGRP
ncbi:MAG: CinA family protein [Actinomycetota bacterium]|nr:CinA family protein [Actinomycetota bacterium]